MIRNLLTSTRNASTIAKSDVFKKYDFIQATKNDSDALVELVSHRFIKFEPHSQHLKLKPQDMLPFAEYLIAKSLSYPYSYLVRDKATSALVGCRLLSVGNRDTTKDIEPIKLSDVPMTGNVTILGEILDKAKANFWQQMDKKVVKVLRREITFIEKEHQRQGIAKALVHHGISFDDLKKQGFDGIVSEASSLANQTLLLNQGYKCLYEAEKKFDMNDGTSCIKVFFKNLKE